jgi:phage repressor protein C with HTH and peptisase S24 domain
MGYTTSRPGRWNREMQVMSARIACGDFIGESDLDPEELEKAGWALIPKGFPLSAGMFAGRLRGDSMTPRMRDGWWALFETGRVGTRQGQIVLVEDRNGIGGNRYTLKVYRGTKIEYRDGTWVHTRIVLHPLNPGYPDIVLEKDDQRYHIVGWYIGCVPEIQRVEKYEYVPSET